MSSHPDADAFVRAILRDPADITTRLVFADWLEESEEPSNVAWAHFIRLNAELATRKPSLDRRKHLLTEIDLRAAEVNARLTIPVETFIAHHTHLWQIFPFSSLLARLGNCAIPLPIVECMPESVARENGVLPLSLQGNNLFIAAKNPFDYDLMQKLQFILNKDIIPVGAEAEDIQAAISRYYGPHGFVPFDSVLVEFTDTATDANRFSSPDESQIPGPVEHILHEVIRLGGRRVQITPLPDRAEVRYLIARTWTTRDACPRNLLPALAGRIAEFARLGTELAQTGRAGGEFRFNHHGAVYTIRATLAESTDGPTIDLDISDHFDLV